MVEQEPEMIVPSLLPLGLVREANQLQKRRPDICQLAHPQPNARIIHSGNPYLERRAYLVTLGEISEYAQIKTFMGTTMSQQIRILPMGSIVFPQALDVHLSTKPSLCEYRAGSITKLIVLNQAVMELLGFSAAVVSYIAHAEDRTIRDLIRHSESLEDDLRVSNENRMHALDEARLLEGELQRVQKEFEAQQRSFERLERICLHMEAQLEERARESHPIPDINPPDRTENDHHLPPQEETSSEMNTIPQQDPVIEVDPEDGLETLPLEDDDDLCSMPTLKPPPPPPSDEPSDEDEAQCPQRKTWREFPAAPQISPTEDLGDTEQRFTMPGVAPPSDNGPPTSLRRTGLVVPSAKQQS